MLAQTLISGTMVQQNQTGILGEFRKFLLLKGKSTNTASSYAGDVGVYAAWATERYGERFSLDMFNRSDLRLFYEHQTAQVKVSPATWNRRRASLRVFAQWAQAQGLVSYDPTDGLQSVDEVQLAPRWLDGREVGRLERALEKGIQGARTDAWKVKAIRDRAIVVLMLKTGLREGEVCRLNMDDLTLGERKGKVAVRYGKGNKSRTAPVNSQALGALRAWLDARTPGGEAVFVGKGGERLMERGVQRLTAEIGRQAGIENLTPHRLRHTCAKSLLDAGTALTVVATLLGHGRLETTLRYTTPSQGDLAAAVEKI